MDGIESANDVLNHFVTRKNFETVAQPAQKFLGKFWWGPKYLILGE